MSDVDQPQSFLFTFRCNGEAHGQPLAEVLVEQLAAYDPSVAPGTYKRSWFGTGEKLIPMLNELGFAELDIQGVTAALDSHRGADRRLITTQDRLEGVGFREMSEEVPA